MGRNFHGPIDAEEYLHVWWGEEDSDLNESCAVLYRNVPYCEALLTSCRETHLLVAGYPVTIVGMKVIAEEFFFPREDWYHESPFAWKARLDPLWYLVRKTSVDGSFLKPWTKQLPLLAKGEIVPPACLMVYATILHFRATGERLFERCSVRCADINDFEERVDIGCCGSDYLVIDGHLDDSQFKSLGLAAVWV